MLFAQQLSGEDWTDIFKSPFTIGIVMFAVCGLCMLVSIVAKSIGKHHERVLRHKERMAMINAGMHPDLPEDLPPADDLPATSAGEGKQW